MVSAASPAPTFGCSSRSSKQLLNSATYSGAVRWSRAAPVTLSVGFSNAMIFGGVMFQLLAFVLAILSTHAHADIPDEYKPIVVKPPFSFSERLLDISMAVERASAENKPLYIYLGASDCPPCRDYENFLSKNFPVLKEAFSQAIVVDIRTWLKGPDLVFKIGEKRYSFTEFKTLVGDTNKVLTYPYYWYISPTMKQLKQLPRGMRHYTQIASQIDILSQIDTSQQPNPAVHTDAAR